MTDLAAIRARHYPCEAHNGQHCQAEGVDMPPWPCDTAIVLAALDKCIAGEDIVLAHDQRDAAIEREARLRAALTITNPEWLKGYDEGVAALATEGEGRPAPDLTCRGSDYPHDSAALKVECPECHP